MAVETVSSRILRVGQQRFETLRDRITAIGAARAHEFCLVPHNLSFEHDGIGLEIDSIKAVKGGVDVYARAWLGKDQIGFGPDGAVDIERFHIGNPPLLVPHADGEIISGKRKLRFDPHAALREILSQTVREVGKVGAEIVPGKRGDSTFTLFSTNDAGITSASGTYSTARAGTGTKTLMAAGGAGVGQTFFGSYEIYQLLLNWDISSVSGTLSSVTASLYLDADSSDTDFTIEMRAKDYQVSVATSMFIAGASLSAATRYASRSTSGITAHAYNALTSDAAFLTYVNANLALNFASANVSSSRQAGNNSPTGDEFLNVEVSGTDGDAGGTSTDPKLVIVTATASIPKFMYHYRQQGLA